MLERQGIKLDRLTFVNWVGPACWWLTSFEELMLLTRHPDGILTAPTSSDAPVDAISQAMSEGIPVVTADNRVRGTSVTAHLAADNLKAGGLAADKLVAILKASGQPLTGKIGLIAAPVWLDKLRKCNRR